MKKLWIVVYWWSKNEERDIFLFWQDVGPTERLIVARIKKEYDYQENSDEEGYERFGPFDIPESVLPVAKPESLSGGIEQLIKSFTKDEAEKAAP